MRLTAYSMVPLGHPPVLHANSHPRHPREHELCRSCVCWFHHPLCSLVHYLWSQELQWPAIRRTPNGLGIVSGDFPARQERPDALTPIIAPISHLQSRHPLGIRNTPSHNLLFSLFSPSLHDSSPFFLPHCSHVCNETTGTEWTRTTNRTA